VQRLPLQLGEREAGQAFRRRVHVRAPLLRVHDEERQRGVLAHRPQQSHLLAERCLGRVDGRPRRVVAHGEDRAQTRAVGTHQRARAARSHDLAAVRAPDAPARVGDRLATEHRTRERQLGRRIRPPILGEQMVALRVRLRRDLQPRDAVQPLRRRVHERDPARGVGHDHPLGELAEHGGALGSSRSSRAVAAARAASASAHAVTSTCTTATWVTRPAASRTGVAVPLRPDGAARAARWRRPRRSAPPAA
jgi:hypothetical protein